jgi:hypothetical protein
MRLVLLFAFLNSLHLTAQRISFSAEIEDSTIEILDESNVVSKLMFYVSDLQLETKDGDVLKMAPYYLIDFSNSSSLLLEAINPNKKEVKAIQFKLGIDSITNVSGAFGGALDPTKGMYWSWQSGYINFKMEGKTVNENYILHLGGYASPFSAVQKVVLPVGDSINDILVILPLQEILKEILSKHTMVLSPSLEAVSISEKIASSFYTR